MPKINWDFMLRLHRNPDRIPMARLAEYMREFADLLGADNEPVFKTIVKASTGIAACVPSKHHKAVRLRVHAAQAKPDSRPAHALRSIETMLGADGITEAQLKDASARVIYLFKPALSESDSSVRVQQEGSIDGVVTGLVGADDSMHLYIRDMLDRDLRFIVRDEQLARQLLGYFRQGSVRVYVHGTWQRSDDGWRPEANRCTVDRFEALEEISLVELFGDLSKVSQNAWLAEDDPQTTWRDLRGVN